MQRKGQMKLSSMKEDWILNLVSLTLYNLHSVFCIPILLFKNKYKDSGIKRSWEKSDEILFVFQYPHILNLEWWKIYLENMSSFIMAVKQKVPEKV